MYSREGSISEHFTRRCLRNRDKFGAPKKITESEHSRKTKHNQRIYEENTGKRNKETTSYPSSLLLPLRHLHNHDEGVGGEHVHDRKDKCQRRRVYRCHVDKASGKTALFAATSLRKKTTMQTEMEKQNPDVKFNLEARGGRPRGQLRVRSTHSSEKSNRQHHTCSPTQCYHPKPTPKRRQHQKHRWMKLRQKGESNTSKGINDRFLFDCEYNVNPGFASEHLLAKIKHHVSSTVNNFDQECIPETYSHRIIFMSMMKELEANNKLHKARRHENPERPGAQRLRVTFPSRFLDFVGPGSKNTRKFARLMLGPRRFFGFFTHAKNLVTQMFPAQQSSSWASSPKKEEQTWFIST